MQKIVELTVELVLLIISFVIGKYFIPFLKAKIGVENLAQIKKYVEIFVKAAEQLFSEEKSGAQKLEFVTELITEKANECNITIDEKTIKAMIEEAVYVMNEAKKQ